MVAVVGCRGTLHQRFESKYIPEPNSGCWLWLGSHKRGYGQLRIHKTKLMYASRVSLMLAGRPIADDLDACHHCDNPWCVNPDHLFAGTAKDNAQDAKRKGRLKPPPRPVGKRSPKLFCSAGHEKSGDNLYVSPKGIGHCRKCRLETKRRLKGYFGTGPRGELNGISKLTDHAVRHIRTSARSGADLARLFGVTQSSVSAVRRNVTWRHVA